MEQTLENIPFSSEQRSGTQHPDPEEVVESSTTNKQQLMVESSSSNIRTDNSVIPGDDPEKINSNGKIKRPNGKKDPSLSDSEPALLKKHGFRVLFFV